MSCSDGNRFVCGIRRMTKHATFTSDKPTNVILHSENTKRLSELMRLREQQDKGVFEAPSIILNDGPNNGTGKENTFGIPQFTPWVSPSAHVYNNLKKIN